MYVVNKIKFVDDMIQWNESLLSLPAPHVLQSWLWGAFKERHGWQAVRLLWRNGTGATAAAQVLVQQRRFLRVGYVAKGPIADWKDVAQVARVLAGLEDFARAKSLLLMKIDPDVRANTAQGHAIRELLEQRGWRPSFEQIQFCNTMVLDLRPDLDTIMKEMKSKWRYNIRLAGRRDVSVEVAKEADLPALYQMYAETAQRDQFIIREASYYLDVWRTFNQAGQAVPLVATVDGESVAMLVLLHFGQCAWYMYGASRDIHRDRMPNHRLQWEAIKHAKAQGCTRYDMWGAPDILDESDPMWGVYRFKLGFGAEFVPHIGAYDYAPNPFIYRLYAILRQRQIAWAQKRYWKQKS